MPTARQVPLENEVFVGNSPQDTHGENADKQLANLQKRIWLIEFLRLGLVIVYQGSGGAVFQYFYEFESRGSKIDTVLYFYTVKSYDISIKFWMFFIGNVPSSNIVIQ